MKNNIQLPKVRLDGGTQPRAKIDTDLVNEYAERLKAGDEFPPVDLFHDGVDYWLADGFHRYHAAKKRKDKVIGCTIHEGTVRDAILFSCGVNGHHGLRRTHADKRKAVEILFADDEWAKYSDGKIADICAVSQAFVSNLRRELKTVLSSDAKRLGRDGKLRPAKRKPTIRVVSGDEPDEPQSDIPPMLQRDREPGDESEHEANAAGNLPIPERLQPVFALKRDFAAIIRKIGSLINEVKSLAASPAGTFLEEKRRYQGILTDLKNAQEAVKFCAPHEPCPYCKGAGCKREGTNKTACRETGWVNRGVTGDGR